MNKEKIVLSFIALFLGLIVAGVLFYFYQSTKVLPDQKTKQVSLGTAPTPTPSPIYLAVDSPKDEDVVNNKILTVSGKTAPGATLIISTDTADQVVTPSSVGNFSTTVTLGDGENVVEVTAIAPSGLETTITRTITYSTENF